MPITSLAAVAMVLLAPFTLAAWTFAVQAIVVPTGRQPVYLAYVNDPTSSWIAVVASTLAVITVLLSIAVRPRPASDLLGASGR